MDGEPETTLTVDELVLRPWRPADATEVFGICQDPEIARWVTIPQPFLPADADAFIEGAQAMWRDGVGAPFAIVDAATEQLLGAVTRFGPDGHQATFGLWLAPAARGRGVGTRALRWSRIGRSPRQRPSAWTASSWSATSRPTGWWSAPVSSARVSPEPGISTTAACPWIALSSRGSAATKSARSPLVGPGESSRRRPEAVR